MLTQRRVNLMESFASSKYKWRGSPTAGDGKIYFMNHNGMVRASADKGNILHQAQMGIPTTITRDLPSPL